MFVIPFVHLKVIIIGLLSSLENFYMNMNIQKKQHEHSIENLVIKSRLLYKSRDVYKSRGFHLIPKVKYIPDNTTFRYFLEAIH